MKKVSDVLHNERLKKGLSFEEIEKATKIKREFLESIEKGEFKKLPSESYALGFVKTYSNYLGLNAYQIAALFRREYAQEKQEIVPRFRKEHERFKKKNHPLRLIVVIGTIFVVFLYVFFQYGSLLLSPKLELTSPSEKDIIEGNVIKIVGKTDQYASVVVNGDEIPIAIDGSFTKSLFELSGEKVITIVAKNKFGRTTQKILHITVR